MKSLGYVTDMSKHWKWMYASIHDGGLETEGTTYGKLCNISPKQHLNLP